MKSQEITDKLQCIAAEAESIGPYLEGNLLKNKKTKYTCRNGKVSEYPTSPVLQYKASKGKRKSKRIPKGKVPVVESMLRAGKRREELMSRHRELSAMLALDFKKNFGN